jgi:hypothetical protein
MLWGLVADVSGVSSRGRGRGDGARRGRRVDWEVKEYLQAAWTGAKDAGGGFVDRGVY